MRRLALALVLLTPTAAWADQDDFVAVMRGRDLATAGDCIACHTNAGSQPYSGGRGLETPFGVITSANLTPDLVTGIGRWTADDFYNAMHNGLRPDGTHLYPAFPYTYYTKVTRADTDAIFAFLRTLPPTPNAVDRSTLPFPFDVRASLIAWNAMFFVPGTFTPNPAKSSEFNRGAYLVEGLAHCGACHTPMNMLGSNKVSQFLQGNNLQAWYAPNITDDKRLGLGSWSVDDVVEYLHTGRNAYSAASGPMAEVVGYSTALMPVDDLRAIATYLKESGAQAEAAPTPVVANDPVMQQGQAVYTDTCSACHRANGTGIDRLFPRLAGSQNVQQPDSTTLARVVISGVRAAVTSEAPTAPAMPSLGWRLSDPEIAAVLTYIRNSWGNAAAAVSEADVSKVRARVADQKG